MSRASRLLLAEGVVSKDQLAEALALQSTSGGTVGWNLVRTGALDEEALAQFLADRLGVSRAPAHEVEAVTPDMAGLIPAKMALDFSVLPLRTEGTWLTLAMADPSDDHAISEVAFQTGMRVLPVVDTDLPEEQQLTLAALCRRAGVAAEEQGMRQADAMVRTQIETTGDSTS